MNTYIFLDVETTGLDPARHGIVSIGAVVCNELGDVLEEFYAATNPGDVEIDPGALAVNGFTVEEIANARPIADALQCLSTIIAARTHTPVMVMHNAPFDVGFMIAAYRKAGYDTRLFRRTLCTISLAFATLRDGICHSLLSVSRKLSIDEPFEHHTALADANQCRKVFFALRALSDAKLATH
jgi:DNA polymerase III epsilon subunit-like protein